MFDLRKSSMERAKGSVKDAVAYVDDLVRDAQLREDLRSALGHGVVATRRVRGETGLSGLSARLAADKELRSNLRALLDDLDSAAERVRRRSSHPLRNAFLIVAGSGGLVLAAVPSARQWISDLVNGNGNKPSSRSEWSAETDSATD